MSQDRIEQEIVIEAPIERVWAVLTEAKHIAGWFGDSAEIDLRPGGAAVFGWAEYGTFHAIVERVEPMTYLAYRGAREKNQLPAPGNSTLVEFTLIEEGAQTRLRVAESGFSSLDGSDELRRKAVQDNTQGWIEELGELREYAQRAP